MDVFDLVAKIRLDSTEYEEGIGKAKGGMSSLVSGIGKGLAVAGAAAGAAISAAAAGVVKLTQMGVQGYARYEQLVGGVETLFKESGSVVRAYAENAYMTSGLSANAYMETVTSFSASLIQSLNGDTAKAAEVADMAITDMSDNANKMGSSIEMLQNAYNGFAKGNFTMLDNLKLGYGGTKEEMQRLLKDAQKISGIKYDISSYADIAEAIHVIQEEMGIAGATAEEAATTIEGSLGMMKGAWQNLIVGMADSESNMSALINNFVNSAVTVANNIMPVVEQTLVGIGQLVDGLAPIVAEKIPVMVETLLPSLLGAATTLVTTVIGALPSLLDSMLPVVISAVFTVFMAIIDVFKQNGSQLLQTGIDAIMQIVNGISASLPDIIAAAVTVIAQLVNTLTSPKSLKDMLNTALTLVESIVTGIIDNLPLLIDAAIQLMENLVAFITEPSNLEKLLTMAFELVTTIMDGLIEAIPQLTTATIALIKQLVAFLLDPANISMLLGAALDIVLAILDGLLTASVELITGADELINTLITQFQETDWAGVASEIIDKLLEGLKSAWESVKSWFSGVWDSLFGDVQASMYFDESTGRWVWGYHKTGLDYVPYDGYPAILHRGEAVLTSVEARAWRNGELGATPAMAGGVVINQYIQSVPQTPVEFAEATEAYFEQARWTI